jgi:hypothetical protein
MLLYEMMTGLPPWYTTDCAKLFRRLKRTPLDVPSYFSIQAANCVSALLERNPRRRLRVQRSSNNRCRQPNCKRFGTFKDFKAVGGGSGFRWEHSPRPRSNSDSTAPASEPQPAFTDSDQKLLALLGILAGRPGYSSTTSS